MQQFWRTGFLAAATLVAAPSLFAHGGQYRGPCDTNPDIGGGKSPGPAGPSTPGQQLDADLGKWQYWWEFNKDRYLTFATGPDDSFLGPESERKGLLGPSDREIADTVVPALIQTLGKTRQRDVVSSCLIALAKIGKDEATVITLLEKRLSDQDQEIAETAAIALGILAKPAGASGLIHVVNDTREGRALVGQPGGVNDRTRSFAAYGLGLIAHGNNDLELEERIFQALERVLADERLSQRNGQRDVRIAAVNALRLLHVSATDGAKAQALHARVIETLMTFYDLAQGAERQAQAHVPAAIATLVGRNFDPAAKLKKRFRHDLENSNQSWIRQSCALALGQMATPDDAEYSKALQDCSRSGKDRQARRFALISLGQIGGQRNRCFLLEQVQDARTIDPAWAAIAVGVLSFELRKADKNAGIDRAAGEIVRRRLAASEEADVQAGLCVALGLLRCNLAAEDLVELLRAKSTDADVVGYACVGLALMNHRDSIHEIGAIAQASARCQERLRPSVFALGLLGDETTADTLIRSLKDKGTGLTSLTAIASALGHIRAGRSIAPLVAMLQNDDLTPLARAFAAVALGTVADRKPCPWSSTIAMNLNYRASTATLTNQVCGILDIL